jgi:hypothetical protein
MYGKSSDIRDVFPDSARFCHMWVRLFEDFDQHLQNHTLYYFSFSFPATRFGLYIIVVQEILGRFPQFGEIIILWYIPHMWYLGHYPRMGRAYPSNWPLPPVNPLTATRHTPQWRLPFGECTFPNGNSPYPPQWGVPTGHCPLLNGDSPLGSVQSQMWTPRWGLGSVHSRMESPHRGVYTPQWDSPLGNVHSPMTTPRWGVYPPQWGLSTGDCTLPNGESRE